MILSNRTFGVEIEHGNPTFSEYSVSQQVRARWPKWTQYDNDADGVEIISPILCGDLGLAEVQEVMNFLQAIGGTVSKNCGFHVHHDGREFLSDASRKTLHVDRAVRLATSWYNNQKLISTLVAEHRRNGQYRSYRRGFSPDFCCYKPLTKEYISTLQHANPRQPGCWSKFWTINIAGALMDHSTIEIRQLEGTWDFEKVAAWIHFGQSIIEESLSRKKALKQQASVSALLRNLGLSAPEIKALMKEVKQ